MKTGHAIVGRDIFNRKSVALADFYDSNFSAITAQQRNFDFSKVKSRKNVPLAQQIHSCDTLPNRNSFDNAKCLIAMAKSGGRSDNLLYRDSELVTRN